MPDRLSRTFAALADPTRRAMLARLSRGEASVSDLSKPFLRQMSRPAITKHLKVLEKAGLITRTRQAQWRPCQLKGAGLREIADWMEQYRQFWEESLDRLEDYLKTVTSKPPEKGKPHGRKT
jgi:DNA-binding transcriptional ArsR family regulator